MAIFCWIRASLSQVHLAKGQHQGLAGVRLRHDPARVARILVSLRFQSLVTRDGVTIVLSFVSADDDSGLGR